MAQHPKWKLPTIQTHGGKELKHKNYIALWKRQILEGGTKIDKFNFIDDFVITKFHDARKEYKCVKEMHLRQWAIQASQSFRDTSFCFKASRHWAANFKNRHSIVSRKVTKLVSRRKILTMDTLLESAKQFQESIKLISSSFKPGLILNTDQVGFVYEFTENRTLSYKGEKETLATAKSPRNLVTHSYTAQYTINMDGKIVGDVFVCLQEASGRLGPIVEETLIPVPNVTLTCSTSGKMTRSLCEYYLDKIILKNVHEDFVLILDSYGGHTNACSYANRFGVDGNPNCTLKIIPENCTDICQPLDTTFHRQLKYFARAISAEFTLNNSSNINRVDEITTRNNVLRMQSLLHNQLSASIFEDMIKYSWFSSGLTDERPIFLTVSEVCFSFLSDDKKVCEICSSARFLKCAHCQKILCFNCFFYEYHFHFEILNK